MPLIDGDFRLERPAIEELHRIGPIVEVEIRIPQPLQRRLAEEGQSIPHPISGIAVIDTGASITGVEMNVLQSLGIQPVSRVILHTPSGPATTYLYPVSLILNPRSPNPLGFDFGAVASVSLGQLPIPGGQLIALLGRDFLRRCVLIYHGPQARFTLCL